MLISSQADTPISQLRPVRHAHLGAQLLRVVGEALAAGRLSDELADDLLGVALDAVRVHLEASERDAPARPQRH